MQYEIRNANLSDAAELKQLWKDGFDDSQENIDRFFDGVYVSNRAFVATCDSGVVAMMFLLSSSLKFYGESYKSGYIYGVTTDLKHRGNGIMTRLEEYVCNVARERGMSLLALVPASKALFKMYEKIGYKTAFYKQTSVITPKPCSDYELLSCASDSFISMRDELLAGFDSVFELDQEYKKYRFELLNDDDMLLYKDANGCGYIVGKKQGHSYEISETNLAIPALFKAAYGLTQKYYNLKKITVIGKNGRVEPYGMLKSLSGEINSDDIIKANPYMNLMLE